MVKASEHNRVVTELEAENKRLRDALEEITDSDNPYDVAWQALGEQQKGGAE